jgi:hypothetical protein
MPLVCVAASVDGDIDWMDGVVMAGRRIRGVCWKNSGRWRSGRIRARNMIARECRLYLHVRDRDGLKP